MKAYVKPTLQLYSLHANDTLCTSSGCSAMLSQDSILASNILIASSHSDRVNDGITKDDFTGLFGQGESCAEPVSYTEFCKFTASPTSQVFWS